jgi:hypothetical protein
VHVVRFTLDKPGRSTEVVVKEHYRDISSYHLEKSAVTGAQHNTGSLHPVPYHQYPDQDIRLYERNIREATETERHLDNMNRVEGFSLMTCDLLSLDSSLHYTGLPRTSLTPAYELI